ncbi:hypothetical protein OIU84_016160 [Salix udensis]|uniref:Uncharacterized protein n=1 Tax=Salix udensis TaxID=889485 RepID=A0AAD6J8T2_9ROSI|nr:hypothetical protein OIU84_016160 [Salix udensis]
MSRNTLDVIDFDFEKVGTTYAALARRHRPVVPPANSGVSAQLSICTEYQIFMKNAALGYQSFKASMFVEANTVSSRKSTSLSGS